MQAQQLALHVVLITLIFVGLAVAITLEHHRNQGPRVEIATQIAIVIAAYVAFIAGLVLR